MQDAFSSVLHGTRVEPVTRMEESTAPTVEMSLAALSEAIGRASQDFTSVRSTIDRARADIANRNTAVGRDVVREAERVIDHLRRADEALRDVLKDLATRD